MRKILYSLALAIPLFAETLDELVTYATTHSTAVKQAKVQSELATLNRKQNQAGMYGELDLVGSVTHYNLDRTLAPLTPTVIASGQPITTSKDLYFAGINYNLPLFTGFAQTREVEMDKIAEKMADVRLKLTKEQLAYNVRTLYLNILSLQEIKKAQHAYVNALQQLTSQIAKEVHLGKKAKIDLLKSKTSLQDAKTGEALLQSNIKITKAALSALTGKKITTLSPVTIDLKTPHYDLNTLMKEVDSLSKVKVENMQLQKAQKMIQKAKAGNYPQLALNASAGRNYGEDSKRDEWDGETLWQVGLNAKYNLLDFGKRSAGIQKAKISRLQAKLKKEQTLLDIQKEITQAIAKIEQSYATYLGNKAQHTLARQSAKIEQVRYENEASTLNDLLLAKAKVELSASKLIQGKYDYQKNIYYLEYLLEKGVH